MDSSHAAIMLREHSAAGSDVSCQWVGPSGIAGKSAWSSSPAPQTWNTLAATWDKDKAGGQLLPYLNAAALSPVAGSVSPMIAAPSPNPLWLGYTPHTIGDFFFHGEIGFAGIIGADVAPAWVEEFSRSNPFDPAWSYGVFGEVHELPPSPPGCPCDWDGNGAVESSDFFVFLEDFFAGEADFDLDGVTNSQDVFGYLECFFAPPAGCGSRAY
jgi:hypothetical protein